MRVTLDACVLVPTVMRGLLVGAAEAGLFEARWSVRIEEEWVRAAGKAGPGAEDLERLVAEGVRARLPRVIVPADPGVEARLWLPDPGDVHVLASAVVSHSDVIVTMNARDFPQNILGEWGISRADPDGFLLGLYEAHPGVIADLAAQMMDKLRADLGPEWTLRKVMKKARLARLGKALERGAGMGIG